jgi:hypothetical protein
MVNQKVNIEIEDFEDKKSQNGKRYTRFKTNDGWMSAFEKDIIDALKENEGEIVSVEIAIDEEKGFKNIRKFIGKADKIEVVKPLKFDKIESKPNVVAKDTTTMYVSYAKDIFCRLMETDGKEKPKSWQDIDGEMTKAINLVKQAKYAFEHGNANTDNKQE